MFCCILTALLMLGSDYLAIDWSVHIFDSFAREVFICLTLLFQK